MPYKKLLKFLRKKIALRSLTEHKVIGLDLDGTLLSGPYCAQIEEFVRSSKAQFHVISFRHSSDEKVTKFICQFDNIVDSHWLPREIPEFSKEYLEWKGKVCAKHGITALIDDDTLGVITGCLKYKIQYFNALKFGQYQVVKADK